jgi:hypothetical protein
VALAAAATLATGVPATTDGTPALERIDVPHAANRTTVTPSASPAALLRVCDRWDFDIDSISLCPLGPSSGHIPGVSALEYMRGE